MDGGFRYPLAIVSDTYRRTPLFDAHRRLGGKMVPFAGYEMPVQYAGILAETAAVREAVGAFDVSHMARLDVRGAGALEFLEHVASNDVARLEDGRGQYSLLPNAEGGTVDDVVLYRLAEGDYRMVANASNHAKDLAWLRGHEGFDVVIDDVTETTFLVAIQGPKAVDLVASLADAPDAVRAMPFFGVLETRLAEVPVLLARSGYTGEDGFEITGPVELAERLWDRFMAEGATPCGLGSRDTLRVEAGLPLYGHELSDDLSPIAAGLGWAIGKTKRFVGSAPIARAREEGVPRKLVGLTLAARRLVPTGAAVLVGEKVVGEVTSGVVSPTLGHAIALAFVDSDVAKGSEAAIDLRGTPRTRERGGQAVPQEPSLGHNTRVNIELLKELTEAHGVSGREDALRAIVRREMEPLVDDLRTDAMGNVIAHRKGSGPKLMLAAHMDEIGFAVKYIEKDGFLRLKTLGGWDPRQMNSQRVVVGTSGGPVSGLLMYGTKPAHMLSDAEKKDGQNHASFFVDLGISADDVRRRVSLGDPVTMDRPLQKTGDHLSAKAMDDRAGLYVMIEAVRAAARTQTDLYAVATVQEEVGLRGAAAAGSGIAPDVVVALDVTLANDIPGVPEQDVTTKLGEGAAIKILDSSLICHPKLVAHFRRLAEAHGIKHQMEVLSAGGTDAGAVQTLNGGVPAFTLSIPTRYIHTVNETVHPDDLDACVALLARYVEDCPNGDYAY